MASFTSPYEPDGQLNSMTVESSSLMMERQLNLQSTSIDHHLQRFLRETETFK